jgi:hypothetical protein
MNFDPTPTAAKFMADRSKVKIICGPVGGGKSTAALFECLKRAVEQTPYNGVRRTKIIVTRNTMPQLKTTVKPLIDQWFVSTDGAMGAWRVSDMTFEMRFTLKDGTEVHTELMLMAADTPDDIRRLLSLECSFAWIEEAREYDPEVFSALQGRTNRFPNRAMGGVTFPGLICSTNPPPMGTWWQEVMANPPEGFAVFMQPPALLDSGQLNPAAENLANLASTYYEDLVAGKSPDWIDVYLKNKFGAGGFGQPVFKSTFKPSFHVSAEPLKPIYATASPLIVGMDNGLTAAAVVMQQDARGRVNVLGESYVPEGSSMGVESFLDRILIPYFQAKFPVSREHVLFVLDPACFQRSQVNEVTIAQSVNSRGFRCIRASTNDPERRIAAVEGLLTRAIDGGPGIMLSGPDTPWLTKAMDWGYRNKKQLNGQVTAVPEKNHFSHIADALQYGCLHYNVQLHPALAMFKTKAKEVKQVRYRYV